MASSLEVNGLDAGYGAVRVLDGISIRVMPGEIVVLLGTNGNGKSTLMKCIMGIVPPAAGSITAEIDGEPVDLVGRATAAIVDLGITLVPEGRRLFPKLSVEENLLLGAFRATARAASPPRSMERPTTSSAAPPSRSSISALRSCPKGADCFRVSRSRKTCCWAHFARRRARR